ncbi:hypothetical protein ACFVYJ_12825 [Pontibacter sp. JAM-7]|uniref:hypothetical protein n=1 Tax=Pontibacter sp. JAM-7 TaxID=3366581 RepID=UPI003AF49DA2
MEGVHRLLNGGWLVVLCGLLSACSDPVDPYTTVSKDTLSYQVSFVDSSQQRMRVEMDLPVADAKHNLVLNGGVAGEYDLLSLHAVNDQGQEYGVRQEGAYVYLTSPASANSERLRVIYEMRIGGLGRHGHQGNFDERFAAFDGRLYLLPQQQTHIQQVLVRFDTTGLPSNHRVISPWQPVGDKNLFRVSDYGDISLLFKSLRKTLTAVGPFELHAEQVGDTQVEVYTYADWLPAQRQSLTDTSLRLFRYFNAQFGYEVAGGPYQIVWHPTAKDGRKVWSAVWSNGMAYEMVPDNPAAMQRNWELFGHRVAHPINEYAPWGMRFAEPDEHWFLEGWASYIELVAGEQAGVFNADQRWQRLYRRYLDGVIRNQGSLDFPLAQERQINDAATKEFIHYTKAPLVTRLLAHAISQQNGGSKSLEGFMAEIYARHRGFSGSVALKAALQEYAGLDVATFWHRYVDSDSLLLPLWRAPQQAAAIPAPDLAGLIGLACSLQQPADRASLTDYAYVRHVLSQSDVAQGDAYLSELPMGLRARFFRDRLSAYTQSTVYPQQLPGLVRENWPAEIVQLQHRLTVMQQQALASLNEVYLKGYRLGSKTQSGLAVDLSRRLFTGGAGRIALNLFWLKDGHKVRYRVLKSGDLVFEKVRPVKTGWATTLTYFSLAPAGDGDGIYAGPGDYQIEVWIEDETSQRLASLPFRLEEAAIVNLALGTERLTAQDISAYLLTSAAVEQPSVGAAYRQLLAAQQVLVTPVAIADLHQAKLQQHIDQQLWRQWAEGRLNLVELTPLQQQFEAILTALSGQPEWIDATQLMSARLTAEAYQNQPCDQSVFAKDSLLRLTLTYANRHQRELHFSLQNVQGEVVWQKQRRSLAKYSTYWVDIGPIPAMSAGRYQLVVMDQAQHAAPIFTRWLWVY